MNEFIHVANGRMGGLMNRLLANGEMDGWIDR